MTNLRKNYFIVLDRDNSKRNELVYDVNFFYLKSLKRSKKKSFSYISKPFFRGHVIFGLDFKDKLRPLRFEKIQKDGEITPVDPKLFKKFLIADENKYIAFSSQASYEEQKPILDMLSSFQIDKSKVIKLTFCKACLDDKKFKILDKGHQIKSFKNKILCPNCALDIVLRQANIRNLVSNERFSPKLKNFFRHLILKFKDIHKVLDSFKPGFNPSKNKDITLYDVETNTPVNKKYLNFHVDDLNIQKKFKKLLTDYKITKLLPIQALAVERGLLTEFNDQLIMAPTSGGKTLVGELAGVSNALRNKNDKMLYLVPIVALANIREVEFKEKYSKIDLRVIKKVGESLLDKKNIDNLEDLKDSDIIVATYEAIDYILRSGNKSILGKISTIIIDEIQTLIEPERGFILDGLISRLKSIYKQSQYLYLSATIGEPEILAKKLGSQLIRYSNRPVPIERHLLLCQNEKVKLRYITKLVRSAFSVKSEYGFKGQTIIFTNARKKCESITTYLNNKGIWVRSYHSGLTNEERKIIEKEFQTQKISGVVATAALAAGVDLPASQVIFESLAMGIKWLTVADFEQMLGRAGRLKKHKLGRVFLLVQPEKIYSPKMEITEENIAIRLLNGKIRDFELEPNEDRSLTELLAFISMHNKGISNYEVEGFYNSLINGEYEINAMINKLKNMKLVIEKESRFIQITDLGRAIAKSFFTVEKSFDVIQMIKNKSQSIKEIVLNIRPLRNVYLSKSVVADLSKNVNMKYFSNNFFSASVLSLMDAEYVKKRKKFSRGFIDLILKWINDIFICSCKENPYCECGRLNLEKIILDLRIEDKMSVDEIYQFLEDEYQILIFKGDLIDYLESLIYSFESIKNIVDGIPNLSSQYERELQEIPEIVKKIKGI
ncbi:MAG: DEAD/DEAH box helicase [Candidatus Lokiarchaeota archaeon]|nr:DEAD/DEAH box helicase [Candidatus Lokiarchaeota archaeon]MBD3199540.1 DEAD/DEAH box helicase [Candidatus Lokiarchaeota archaeon]